MCLKVIDLGFHYETTPEPRKIFEDASACFSSGRFYALMGPSGSGKTTLFRILTRELEPVSGKLVIGERDLASIPVRELRTAVIGRVFQDYLLIPFLTPLQNLMLAREIAAGRAADKDRERATHLLAQVGLAENATRPVESMSGGEQQRVAIARALMSEASILLADEPTGALDRRNTAEIGQLLASLARDHGIAVIAGTHDQAFAEYADSVVRIHNYRLVTE